MYFSSTPHGGTCGPAAHAVPARADVPGKTAARSRLRFIDPSGGQEQRSARRRSPAAPPILSPEMYALLRRQIVFGARLYVERLVPFVLIARRANRTEFRRAVLVGKYLLTQRAFAILALPDLAKRQVEALIAGV